jgi:phosphate transport system protein
MERRKKMIRLHKEIERLKKRLLTLGAEVEERLDLAVKAIDTRDQQLAKQIITGDVEVDEIEVEVEEECLKVLALHQPVASDLRVIISVLKINNDLERIGDLAVDIAERAQFLATCREIVFPFNFPAMSKKVKIMLQKSLDAFVNLNEELANEVCSFDDEVDDLHSEMFTEVEKAITEHPENIQQLLCFSSVSRYLERIADHATNIAEDVIYLVKGEIVRHSKGMY